MSSLSSRGKPCPQPGSQRAGQSQPSACCEIQLEGPGRSYFLSRSTSAAQRYFLEPYESPSCFQARTCVTERPLSVAGSFTVGPEPRPPLQGPCPLTPPRSTWSLGLQGLLGFLPFIPFQPVYPPRLSPASFPYLMQCTIPSTLTLRLKVHVSYQSPLLGVRVRGKKRRNSCGERGPECLLPDQAGILTPLALGPSIPSCVPIL